MAGLLPLLGAFSQFGGALLQTYKKGDKMARLESLTTMEIDAEYNRLIRAIMAGDFPQSKRRYFYALRTEWQKRQQEYNR